MEVDVLLWRCKVWTFLQIDYYRISIQEFWSTKRVFIDIFNALDKSHLLSYIPAQKVIAISTANHHHSKLECFVFHTSLCKELTFDGKSSSWRNELYFRWQQVRFPLQPKESLLVHDWNISSCVNLEWHISFLDLEVDSPWLFGVLDDLIYAERNVFFIVFSNFVHAPTHADEVILAFTPFADCFPVQNSVLLPAAGHIVLTAP